MTTNQYRIHTATQEDGWISYINVPADEIQPGDYIWEAPHWWETPIADGWDMANGRHRRTRKRLVVSVDYNRDAEVAIIRYRVLFWRQSLALKRWPKYRNVAYGWAVQVESNETGYVER